MSGKAKQVEVQPETAPSSQIDQIVDDAAAAIHDMVRVMRSVQKVGDGVSEASQSVSKEMNSPKTGSNKAWSAAKSLTADRPSTKTTAGKRPAAQGAGTGRKAAPVRRAKK
jgi:hypothetical protein